jgi:enoyl-CoA hydratase/carnithine racemase
MSLEVVTQGAVASITLDRVQKANAYTQPMLADLSAAIEGMEADGAIRVVVITGKGSRAFSAGADRSELETRMPESGGAPARCGGLSASP